MKKGLLVLLLGLLLALVPFYVTITPYVLNIFMQAATYAIAVLGMTVVLGYAGQINLAQATFFGLGAYAVGLGTIDLGLNFWITLLMAVAVSTIAGFILGLTTLRNFTVIRFGLDEFTPFAFATWRFLLGALPALFIPKPNVSWAALAGIGGALYAAGFAYISPDNFNFARSIEFLTMVLLGGAQSPFGGALGTGLLILLPEWLRFLKEIYLAVYGIAVILIMVFLPAGIWGLITARLARLRKPAPIDTAGIPKLDIDVAITNPAPILKLDNVQKHFGGVRAVDGITLSVARGTVHALIGPNGSGKTTMLNVLNGIYQATAGTVEFDGVNITDKTPHERAGFGIGRTFQNIRLFPTMSVVENVMVGAQRPNNPIGAGYALLRERALSALQFVGMAEHAEVIVQSLPYGHQRLVEIARALAGHPSFLLLDEPAAGLNQTEKHALAELLKRLRGHGLTIFLIEHDIGLIENVSDRITVLNFGKKIAEGDPATVLRHPDVIAAYLGEPSHGAA